MTRRDLLPAPPPAFRPAEIHRRHDLRAARVFLLAAGLVTVGCHSEAYRAATVLNIYDYRESRFEEGCLPYSAKPYCATAKARLDAFRRHAQEAAAAVKNGGSAKLQLDLAEKDAKGVRDIE